MLPNVILRSPLVTKHFRSRLKKAYIPKTTDGTSSANKDTLHRNDFHWTENESQKSPWHTTKKLWQTPAVTACNHRWRQINQEFRGKVTLSTCTHVNCSIIILSPPLKDARRVSSLQFELSNQRLLCITYVYYVSLSPPVILNLVGLVNSPQPEHPLRADLAEEYSKDRAKFMKNAEEFTKKHSEKRPVDWRPLTDARCCWPPLRVPSKSPVLTLNLHRDAMF